MEGRRKERKCKYPLICPGLHFLLFLLPSCFCPPRSSKTPLTQVLDNLLVSKSDGYFSALCSLNLFSALHTQLATFCLLITHSLVFWYHVTLTVLPQTPLSQSVSESSVLGNLFLSVHALFWDPLIFSFGFSYVFYKKLPPQPWSQIFHLNLFPFFLPPSTSSPSSSGSSCSPLSTIYPLPSISPAPSESKPRIPSCALLQASPQLVFQSRSCRLQSVLLTEPISNVNLSVPLF